MLFYYIWCMCFLVRTWFLFEKQSNQFLVFVYFMWSFAWNIYILFIKNSIDSNIFNVDRSRIIKRILKLQFRWENQYLRESSSVGGCHRLSCFWSIQKFIFSTAPFSLFLQVTKYQSIMLSFWRDNFYQKRIENTKRTKQIERKLMIIKHNFSCGKYFILKTAFLQWNQFC